MGKKSESSELPVFKLTQDKGTEGIAKMPVSRVSVDEFTKSFSSLLDEIEKDTGNRPTHVKGHLTLL